MIVPDRNYDAVRRGLMQNLINVYSDNPAIYEDEKWDCDDIARDFWNYAKIALKNITGKNAIVGRVIFREHAEIIYTYEKHTKDMSDSVRYIDQRDWSLRKPDKKPKWLEL